MSARSPDTTLASTSGREGEEAFARARTPPSRPARGRRSFGLAERVLLLTMGFVLITIVSYYVTRLANFRESLAARLVRDRAHRRRDRSAPTSDNALDDDVARHILGSVGAKSIVIETPGRQRVLRAPGPEAPRPARSTTSTIRRDWAAFSTPFGRCSAIPTRS